MRKVALISILLALGLAHPARSQQSLILPTRNDALYRGGGPDFYMYVERNFQGEKSNPWQGGQYGFVRNPRDTPAGRIFTKFHEGIDIRPMQRDPSGIPLDPVLAVDVGKVVHVNPVAGASNYGIYVVIEHLWEGCRYYSLYAHLRSASVSPGATVRQGQPIGILGWTGAGISLERAHVHFEIALLLNTRFEEWYGQYSADSPNRHGLYNGMNLVGMDVASFYLAKKKEPALTVAQFLRRSEPFFRVLIPNSPNFQLVRRYPWLAGADLAASNPVSWEIHLTTTGVPVRAVPSTVAVTEARLSGIRSSPHAYPSVTRGLVAGVRGNASLSASGKRAMHLLTFPDGGGILSAAGAPQSQEP